MKKSFIFAIALSLLVAVFALSAVAADIGSAADLTKLINDTSKWDGDFVLTKDIDISSKQLGTIGTYEKPFTGTFDGNGHTITVDIVSSECGGLFGIVEGATVKNLTVKGRVECTFAAENAETKLESGYSATGGVVGVVHTGSVIENCVNYAEVYGPCNVGGVIGLINNVGEVTIDVVGCKNYGVVNATYGNLGGVIGRIRTQTEVVPALTVKGCANYADIHYESEDRARLGGIAAYVRSNTGFIVIEDCRNEGNLEGVNDVTSSANYPFVAGMSGRVEMVGASSGIHYINCYNSGMMSSTKYAAGMIGLVTRDDACIENSFTLKNCVNVGALTGGTYAGGMIAHCKNDCMADTRAELVNCLNTAPVVAEGSAGGMIGRQYGFDVKSCVNVGTVEGVTCGGLVGKAEGQVFCEIVNSFYPDTMAAATGMPTPFCMDSGSKAFPASAVNASASFGGLDFATEWTMGKLCPVPKAVENLEIVIPAEKAPALTPPAPETTAAPVTEAPAETTAAPVETTAAPVETTAAPVETTAAPVETTAAPVETTAALVETTAAPAPVAPAKDGAPIGLIIGIAVAVVAVAAIAFVVLKKKKA